MSGTPAPTSVYRDLLQRVCDIAAAASWTNADGVVETIDHVIPRRFTPISAPYPLVVAYVSSTRYVPAQHHVDHFAVVTIQVWGGPVAAGYSGEMEDRLNYVYGALPYEFERRPYLDSPADGTPFDYLMPDDAAGLTENTLGTDGFEVVDGNGNAVRYFGTEFLLSVHLRLPRARLS